ncbi:MAG: 6-phosphofructokinase [Chloroflexi bacterium]|nr:6-phosphofructokinase [Chloroflexota bacterium]
MKRIGILTGGGDAPGLNAVIRAAVKTADHQGREMVGIMDGYDGIIDGRWRVLTAEDIRGILSRGGTILGAANRGNPFGRKVMRDGQEVIVDMSDAFMAGFEQMRLDALIAVGGDGTLRIALELCQKGLPVVGVPKTIDNDLGGTDVTFGFDTALHTATEAIDKLHTTAEAHHRVMVVELMGRDAGFIALHSGVAGGADVILIPEIPFDLNVVCRAVEERAQRGRRFSIIACSEGARPVGGAQMLARAGDQITAERLGGMGQRVADWVGRNCGMEARCTVLGHVQRGGVPSPFDRWLATRYGAGAVRAVAADHFGCMVALHGTRLVDVPLTEALAVPKRVDPEGEPVQMARELGIVFG